MGKGKKKHHKIKGRSKRIQNARAKNSKEEVSEEASKSDSYVDSSSSKAAEKKKENSFCLNCGAYLNYSGVYAFESLTDEKDGDNLPDESKMSEEPNAPEVSDPLAGDDTLDEKRMGQSDEKNKLRNFQKVVSDDKKEFLKEEKKANGSQLSGRLRINVLDSLFQLTFGYFGTKNMIVIDSANYDTFVGNIEITDGERLNFSQSFVFNRNILFDRITITKILDDKLFEKRNEAYGIFLRTIEERSKTISEDIGCTEDFLQFLFIGRAHSITSDKPFMLLENIIQNDYISGKVKNEAKRLKEVESLLFSRNNFFPKFSEDANPKLADLLEAVQNTSEEGIKNHKRNLLNKCPNNSFQLVCLVATINHLPEQNLLYINVKDIELFSDMMELTDEEDCLGEKIFPENFFEYLWNNFYKRIQAAKQKSLKQLGSVTNPIYYSLLKSLSDVITDMCDEEEIFSKDLIEYRDGELTMTDFVSHGTNDPVSKSLEEQYRLIFRLVKHFEPGIYCPNNKFTYSFNLFKENVNLCTSLKYMVTDFKNLSQERIVWLYIVDCGVSPFLGGNSNSPVKEISLSVLAGFVKFIQEAEHDHFESFRKAAHYLVKFIAKIQSYFSDANSILTNVDHDILNKQINIISQLLCSKDKQILSKHFYELMLIYYEYWENREEIVRELPVPCTILKSDMEAVVEKLLQIVQNAFLKTFKPRRIIMFLRLYNEFLKHLEGIDFEWFISKHSYFPELDRAVQKVTKNDITSYKITKPEDFIEILKKNRRIYPKHFSIEVVKKLLDVISMSLNKKNWNSNDCVKAAGKLLLSVGHSFTHFEDQTDYTDLEHFMRDCTLPFCCVVVNSGTYSEFKQRLDNVENFYLYSRKQNQIGMRQAIDLCEQGVKVAQRNEFKTKIDRGILEKCYDLYSKKLVSLENMKIPEILNDIENELKKIKTLTLDKWSLEFKRNILPVILGDLATIWSLQESKDVAHMNKKIQPHCVQILCILRLLGVDHVARGVPKHFAQVLTGQGKSLVLALLSVVIALTGNEAFIVCYSDYLAKRDETCFDSFFQVFNRFGIKKKISYNTFEDMAKKTLSHRVNGTEISLTSVVSDLILNKLQAHSMNSIEIPKNTVLLFDEADVFFSDTFYGQTYNPMAFVNIPVLLKIQTKLRSIVKEGVSEKSTVLSKIREFIIDEILKRKEYDDFRNFLKTTTSLFERHLEKMVENEVCVSNDINGASKTDFHGYLGTNDKSNFLLADAPGCLSVRLGSISYASLPLRYENILGVSGTLLSLNNSEMNAMKNYGIRTMSVMPSFFGGSKLVFKPLENVSISDTQENWLDKIYKNVNKCIWSDRAVLVFFETTKKLKLFEERYENKLCRLYTLTGYEEPEEVEWRINEAGVARTVTLATRDMGRGVDYQSNDRSVEKNGGIHVIQTFFSLDLKEETQIKGRTARKDNKGSYELILCREHLKILDCSKTETGKAIHTYVELCRAREKITSEKEADLQKNIQKSEKLHNMTLEFFDSLGHYSPEKRNQYLSKFPFIISE